jgi:hypothetical protein
MSLFLITGFHGDRIALPRHPQDRPDPASARAALRECIGLRYRWQRYDFAAPAPDGVPLLRAVEQDRTGIFWG